MRKTLILIIIIFSISQIVFGKYYKGAEYRSLNTYLYGRFEVRMRVPQKSGILASFFTYHEIFNINEWNEIDIEVLGRYNNEVQFNTITSGQVNHVRSQLVHFNPALDYHTYGFEWTPDYVAWFIDGKEVYLQTGSHIQTLNEPQKIMMNIWQPNYENWAGTFDPTEVPAFAYYDWIKYSSYTPSTGSYGTGNNFTPQWIDNLDSLDHSKWELGNHTFNGNNVDFIPNNIIFKNGKMILCLTDNNNLGYTDLNPPSILWVRQDDSTITARFSEWVNRSDAENLSNYLIPGVTINSVHLLIDQQTVELSVSGFDTSKSYKLIAYNIRDLAPAQNKMSARAVNIFKAHPLQFPIKINVGGGAVDGFLPDHQFSPNVQYGYEDGYTTLFSPNVSISGTDNPKIYLSQLIGVVVYRIRVPNGDYNLKLLFAENSYSQTSARVFDVFAGQSDSLDNVDIYKLSGMHSAYVVNFSDINISNRILSIYFSADVAKPILNGIIVKSSVTGIKGSMGDIPGSYNLKQNFPNPFNLSTDIQYTIRKSDIVTLKIYNILGQEVATLVNQYQTKGNYTVNFNAGGFGSGVYLYKLQSGSFISGKKMLLLK